MQRFGGVPSDFTAVCVGARRRSGARPSQRCLRVGATDAFGNARDALVAPRMHRSDAGAAYTIDGSRIFRRLADLEKHLYIMCIVFLRALPQYAITDACVCVHGAMRARAENACTAPIARDDVPSCGGARHRVCGAGGR